MENDGKIRLLRTLQILQEESDAEHPISIVEIESLLKERWGLETYRITTQKDIASLRAAGYSIETIRSTQNRYYLTERTFELPELKLLIDAVESGKFITARKSRVLTEKLAGFASRHEAASLKRNISLTDRVKAGNEQIYYIMDTLNEAINLGKKVAFYYFEYGGDKQKKLKNVGKPYVFSPYTLTWNGSFYYVIGWSDKHSKIATFRVDRIHRTPELLEESAVPKPKHFSLGDFEERSFQLFDGERAHVKLRCENAVMNAVIDHFGEKVKTRQDGDTHFLCEVDVSLSPPFFAWVFEFGGRMRILSPKPALDAYAELLRKAAEE
ncbi:MAG: WYL domain-containing protein [Oscillospiraceae bacterium]|nr:WYL domain-containing protein [Oscillospiraceae bacterium]MBR2977366.1 WYL domain-containing protein [Oscillospiraceae bacterium]